MSKTCFVICPIGETKSQIRKRSDKLFRHVFQPACKTVGYKAARADKLLVSGVITSKILEQIRDSEIVIADLTDHNPNVFYELAIRHAVRRPVICVMNKKDKIPFDLAHVNILSYEDADSADEVSGLKDKLIDQLKEMINNPEKIDYPLTTVFHGSSLVAEHDPFKYVIEAMSDEFKHTNSSLENFKNDIVSALSKEQFIDAEFLDGEDKAFNALTQATKRGKREVRSSRFFPDSVLGQHEYVNAIQGRVQGTDGHPPLQKYYRIIALNNKNKRNDVEHHIMMFHNRPFYLHLSEDSNAFELVIIDDTDAFIHFYRQERVINSTLHIRERGVVWEFRQIYDEFLARTPEDYIFNCEKINTGNISEHLKRVQRIFDEKDMPTI